MVTTREIIAATRTMLDDPEIGKVLHENHTDWETTRHARTIMRRILQAAEKAKRQRKISVKNQH